VIITETPNLTYFLIQILLPTPKNPHNKKNHTSRAKQEALSTLVPRVYNGAATPHAPGRHTTKEGNYIAPYKSSPPTPNQPLYQPCSMSWQAIRCCNGCIQLLQRGFPRA
jgi:hypothetical protein